MPMRQADPTEQADDRTEQTDDERLDQQGPCHLTPAGADSAQQRILALALRRGDREHVVDHEHADTERDEREDRQEQGDEPEAALDVGLRLLGDLRRCQRLGDVRVERGLDPRHQRIVADRSVAFHQHRVDEAGLGDELLGGRRVEQRPRGVAGRHDVVVDGDADEREVARATFGVDLDGVTDRVPGVVAR